MAKKSRDHLFESVELKNRYEEIIAAAATQKPFYEEILEKKSDGNNQKVVKRFGDNDEIDSQENICSLNKMTTNDDRDAICYSTCKISVTIIFIIEVAALVMSLALLGLAVSNELTVEDSIKNIYDESSGIMNHLHFINENLTKIGDQVEVFRNKTATNIVREKDKIEQINIDLGYLSDLITVKLTNLSEEITDEVRNLNGGITKIVNNYTEFHVNIGQEINNLNSQFQNYVHITKSIQAMANRTDRRITAISGRTVLTDCFATNYSVKKVMNPLVLIKLLHQLDILM